jgi:hypothetical protein
MENELPRHENRSCDGLPFTHCHRITILHSPFSIPTRWRLPLTFDYRNPPLNLTLGDSP